jgi:hypothetical protein
MRRIQVGDVLGMRELVTIRSERVQIPLSAPGLKLHERLTLIAVSLERVAQKRASRQNWCACSIW